MSRVVLDTNVLISYALNAASIPGRAVDRVLRGHEWMGTAETVAELYSVLFSRKLDRFVAYEVREGIAAFLSASVSKRRIDLQIDACRDPKDNKFLEAAVAGQADFIVTGDADLLSLNPFRGIEIISPAEFIRRPER